ncbi:hypothetical protein BUALT_Bualt03G0032200 [Buddleja alternifolia]|uniref:Uncharacterized protein n=1 Tax=Buddleja alternifolia TaxID=168488 RepID=A0AAV6XXK3_9LAMI|nr:hypothetical protein BUALT_Bualt03G0032200 [Buddleja alternifolia]
MLSILKRILKKKHTKLVEKYSKLEELKNKFRDCTTLVQQKYDVIEKENENLKQAMGKLKAEADVWKDEKEKESAIRVDLEDEVSALKEEIQLLKQNGNSASQEADEQVQERLQVAEKEISRLKELLERERQTAASEKKNAELERKKAGEAMKKVEMGKNKVNEAQKVANIERKKAEENRLLWERLKTETDALKSMLASEKKNAELERKKADEAMKKVDMGETKANESQKVANIERKKAEENSLLWEKLKTETDALKSMVASERSKCEVAEKKVEAEKQKVIKERKRADLAVAKVEEHRKLAETNLKKAVFEKDRADDLAQKLEEVRSRAEKLEEEWREHLCSCKLVKVHTDTSNTERKKAKKQKKVAKAHKRMATEEKHRADLLSRELEIYKLRVEELQKGLQESVSYRMHADNSPPRYNSVISETDTIKLLKQQLKLEKMLVKHAKKATRVESIRNDMLHEELFHLKHVFLRLQQHLDMLDASFLHGGEGTHHLEKVGFLLLIIGNLTPTRETFSSDVNHKQFISGTDSGLDPPYRGSNRKMLSSAINSSSASFSDRHLVGSQERGAFSVTTSAKLGEDVSNLKRTISRLSNKTRIRNNEHAVEKADNSIGSPIKGNAKESRVGYHEKNRILDAVESIENLYSAGQKLHQRVSEKLSLLHDLLDGQKDEPAEKNLQEDPCRENVRPFKRRKTSCEGSIVIHPLHDSREQKTVLGLDIDQSDALMHASPPGLDVMTSGQCFQDGTDNILEDRCIPQDFVEMASHDYMKLLDLDNAADEKSYRVAIAMPLSPTLPEIEFQGDEKLELDDPEMLLDESSQRGLSTVKDYMAPTPVIDIIDMGKNPIDLELNDVVPSQLQIQESSICCNNNTASLQANNAHFHQIQVSGGELGMPDLSGSGQAEINILSESRIASAPGGFLKYLVLSSDNENNDSILRILQTISNCMPQCSLLHSAEIFLRSLLPPLLKAEDLSMK